MPTNVSHSPSCAEQRKLVRDHVRKMLAKLAAFQPDKRAQRTVHGVALLSRYGRAHEYDEMAAIVDAMPPELRCLIESVFCDSKANASFDVQLRESVPPRIARRIGEVFEQACFVTIGGHNGVSVTPGHVVIDPDW